MKRRILGALLTALCLTGCGRVGAGAEMQKRTMYFFGAFDTMITIIGYSEDQETFDRVTAMARARFEELHRLFDAYNAYEGVENIHTLNERARRELVKVAPELTGLLAFAKEWQPKLRGTVNIAMGGVFRLWHDARTAGIASPEEAALPSMGALASAALYSDLDSVVLDMERNTVFFSDGKICLDVGAVAKGYATELVAQMMLASDMPHFILNAGGNVRVGEPPLDGRANWGVSIQNPDAALGVAGAEASVEVLYLSNLSVVTSGDYERFYVVDGQRYHHIISPQTLMPATENRAVTVVCRDSGLADILSTAVFILPYEESRALVESLPGVEALWILPGGEIYMTEGLRQMSKSGGATAY